VNAIEESRCNEQQRKRENNKIPQRCMNAGYKRFWSEAKESQRNDCGEAVKTVDASQKGQRRAEICRFTFINLSDFVI